MPKNTAIDHATAAADRLVVRAQEILAAQEDLTHEEAARVLEEDAAILGRPVKEVASEIVNVAKAATHDPLRKSMEGHRSWDAPVSVGARR